MASYNWRMVFRQVGKRMWREIDTAPSLESAVKHLDWMKQQGRYDDGVRVLCQYRVVDTNETAAKEFGGGGVSIEHATVLYETFDEPAAENERDTKATDAFIEYLEDTLGGLGVISSAVYDGAKIKVQMMDGHDYDVIIRHAAFAPQQDGDEED